MAPSTQAQMHPSMLLTKLGIRPRIQFEKIGLLPWGSSQTYREEQTLPLHLFESPFPHLQNRDMMEESNCYLQLPSEEGELSPC